MSGLVPGGTDAEVAPGDPAAVEGRVADSATVRRGMGFAAGSFVVNAVVGLASAVLTARVYGLEVIGEYALVTAPWLTLIQFSTLGEQVALSREVAVLPVRDRRATALFLPVLGFSFLLTVVAAVPVLLLGTVAMRGPIEQPDLVLPSIALAAGFALVDNTSWNLDAVLAAYHAAGALFVARLTQVGGFLVLSLVLRPAFPDVWGLTWATILSFVVAFAVRLVLARAYVTTDVTRADLAAGLRRLPGVLGFAVRLVPGRIASGLTTQAGTWILGALGTVAAVGAYSRAASLATRMNDASYRVNELLFPALVQRYERGDREAFESVLVRTLRPVAMGVVFVAAVGGGAADGVMDVFGEGFGRAGGALALLLAAGAVWIVGSVIGQAVVASGRPGVATALSIVRMVATIGAMIPATRAWGEAGVAGGLLFGSVVQLVVQQVALRRWVLSASGTREIVSLLLRVTAAGVPGYLSAALVDGRLDGLAGTAVAGGIGTLAFVAALAAVRVLTADDLAAVRRRLRSTGAPSSPLRNREANAGRGTEGPGNQRRNGG